MIHSRLYRAVRLTALAIAPIALFVIAFMWLRDFTNGRNAGPQFSREEKVLQIIDAFRLYAEAFGECFPPVEQIQGGMVSLELERKLDLPAWVGYSPRWGSSTHVRRVGNTLRRSAVIALFPWSMTFPGNRVQSPLLQNAQIR